MRYFENFNSFNMFKDKKELTVFYIKEGKAYLEDRQGNITILKHCIRYKEKHLKCSYVKALLKQHRGLTIYRVDKYFIIEIWEG